MAYTALYRKFRPLTFSEFVGQEHITKTLKNQIIAGRVGHAYLLMEEEELEKHQQQKVLSRAINCLNPKDGEPCNECEICKEILNGSFNRCSRNGCSIKQQRRRYKTNKRRSKFFYQQKLSIGYI